MIYVLFNQSIKLLHVLLHKYNLTLFLGSQCVFYKFCNKRNNSLKKQEDYPIYHFMY